MAKFTILHKVSDDFNQVAVIDAKDLNDAFKMAQNDFNKEYCSLGVRSTMVGDMIMDDKFNSFIVKPVGFKQVFIKVMKPIASI